MTKGDTAVATGKKVYLRELLHSDVNARYLSWFKDGQVTEFLYSNNLSYLDVVQYIDQGKETKSYFMHAICVLETGLHIGNLKIGPIDWSSMRSDLVTVIGDTNYWGKGLATEAISLGNKIAFDDYDMREVLGHIDASNIGSLKSYFRAGWGETKRISDPPSPELVCVSCYNPKYYSVTIFDGKVIMTKPKPLSTDASKD